MPYGAISPAGLHVTGLSRRRHPGESRGRRVVRSHATATMTSVFATQATSTKAQPLHPCDGLIKARHMAGTPTLKRVDAIMQPLPRVTTKGDAEATYSSFSSSSIPCPTILLLHESLQQVPVEEGGNRYVPYQCTFICIFKRSSFPVVLVFF